MIPIAALILAVAAQPPLPSMTVGELRSACAKEMGGDGAAHDRCVGFIVRTAADLRADPATSTCMSIPSPSDQDVAWAAIDGMEQAKTRDEADAGSAVTAALLAAYPCGILPAG